VSRLRAARPLLAVLLLAASLTGCVSHEEGGAEGDLPQAQPASWEGGLPGMTPSGPPR
jgi:hypothetical protein